MARWLLHKVVIIERNLRMLHAFSERLAVIVGIAFSIISAENPIDAVTSASGDLQLKGGKAYATEAIIVWSDRRSNGTVHTLEWGTTTSYGQSMDLKPFTRNTDVTDTIKPLTPSTKYYARFHRVYPSKNVDSYTNFEFTTSASTLVVPFVENRAVTDASMPPARIYVFSTDGRKIFELPLSDRPISAAGFQCPATPGLYIAVTSGDNYRRQQSVKVITGKR